MVDETEVRRDVVQVLGTPTDGQVPEWDAAQGEWVPQTPSGGGGGGAPTAAEYLVAATHGDLSAERVTTNTATVTWDHTTAGQAKANVPDASTTAKGVVELATSGEASAGVVVQGNDSRLSDARTPTAHASTHAEAGGDRITSVALANTGLTVRDTDDSHELAIAPGSNLTANRTLTIHTGDANRALTLAGDASIAGTNNGDQAALSVIEVQGDSAIELSAPDSVVEIVPGSGIAITTSPAADPPKITIQATTNAFGTVAVTGQTSVVADALADTLTLAAGSGISITTTAASDTVTIAATGGVSDGDKGDITVSASGATWTIDADAVTYAKMQNVSATDKVLGRSTAGAGDIEEIACTAAGRALIDDADAAAQRTTLGLGALAVKATVATADIDADAVTFAKVQNLTSDRLVGRDTAGSGDAEELTVGGGIEFTGSGGIQRSTLAGDVSAAAGSNTVSMQVETLWILFDDMFWASLPNNGWTSGSTGTGATPISDDDGVNSTEKAQGVVQLTTGTTSTGRSSIYQCLNSILFGQGAGFEFEARVYLGALSTASEEFNVHFGFIDNANNSSEPVDSACFVYRRATDGDFWVLQTRSNSSETKTVTTVEPSTSAFAIFKIVVAADGGSVEFFIDGVSKGTHTATIPTGAGRQTGIGMRVYKTAGTTARLVNIDWVRIKAAGSAR